MIETSKDLLYVVLAFSVLWLTIFISWMLYYVIMTLRQVNELVTNVKEKVNRFNQLMEKIKDKFDHSSAYLGVIGKAVEKIVEFAIAKKKKGRK